MYTGANSYIPVNRFRLATRFEPSCHLCHTQKLQMLQDDHYFSVSGPSTSVIDLNLSAADLPRPHRRSRQSTMPPSQSEVHPSKKRKLDRACDFCRRRKTKCDGPSKSNNVCSNCIQNHNRCTYVYVHMVSPALPSNPCPAQRRFPASRTTKSVRYNHF